MLHWISSTPCPNLSPNTRKPHSDRAVIPALIQHLITHSQYSNFEEQYITYTRAFYEAESAEKAVELKDDPRGFFEHARTRVDEEAARCAAVLPVGSWNMVKYAAEWSLWNGRTEWVANNSKLEVFIQYNANHSFSMKLCRNIWSTRISTA